MGNQCLKLLEKFYAKILYEPIVITANLAAHLIALPGMPSPAITLTSITNHNLATQVSTPTGWTAPSGASSIFGRPEKKLLDITLTFSAAHTITNLKISCQAANGELYLVLGGERGDNSTTLANSFKVTIPTSTTILIQGYFPMQLVTEPHVYLRCTLGQNGLESSILGSDETTYNNDIVGSNILAKIARTPESFSYAGNQSGEFFVTLQQRKLNSIGLFLTDSKSRPIGRPKNSGFGTSAGLEGTPSGDTIPYESEKQSSLGNLYFTATIRIDIVKMYNPNKLQSEPPPMPQFPSRASGVISFGGPVGFK